MLRSNSELLENRLYTDYQSRFSILDKNPSQKYIKKQKIEGESKLKLHLSPNDKKFKDLSNDSFHKLHSIEINRYKGINLEELRKQKQNIQKDIKRSCKKNNITKKDLLKISHQY